MGEDKETIQKECDGTHLKRTDKASRNTGNTLGKPTRKQIKEALNQFYFLSINKRYT